MFDYRFPLVVTPAPVHPNENDFFSIVKAHILLLNHFE